MTDPTMTPDPGALDGGSSSTPAARPPTPQPATRTSGPGQAEKDSAGIPRWNRPADPDGRQARWDAQQRERLGHTTDPAAVQPKPDQAATKPADGASDTTHKFGETTISEAELSEFLTNKAARESGKLQAPADPSGYKLELPKDFKPPQGVEVAFNEADPALAQLRGWAHAHQIPQSAFSDLLGIYGGKVAGELALGKMAHDAEVAKLGAAGPGRVDALATWFRGQLGDQGKVLSGVRDAAGNVRGGVLWTHDIVTAFEALMHKSISQGAGSYTASGRDMGGGDSKIPNYANMSFEQRRHAQEQQRRGR
jgi:hypothetical protein